MILDKIENSGLYESIHPLFAKAFDFIRHTDFSQLQDGKYEIVKDDLFALVQEYHTKAIKPSNPEDGEAKLEAHRKYIDIQYMHSGTELIGIAPLRKQVPAMADIEKDIAFYEGEASFIKLESQMFAIFFPEDMHMPGIESGQSKKVKKVVFKVLV